ncbi:MAG: GlsB/YeaQ/YmgE family stress response membrane protein [Pseudomonadota bacterium]
MITFIIALVMGGIIGWLASMVMGRDASMGIFANVIVGCIGSILGGWLFSFFTGGTQNLRDAPFNPITLAVAFGGAVVLLGIVNLIKRGKIR